MPKFLDSSTRDTANSRSEDHLQTENNHVLPATAFSNHHSPFHGRSHVNEARTRSVITPQKNIFGCRHGFLSAGQYVIRLGDAGSILKTHTKANIIMMQMMMMIDLYRCMIMFILCMYFLFSFLYAVVLKCVWPSISCVAFTWGRDIVFMYVVQALCGVSGIYSMYAMCCICCIIICVCVSAQSLRLLLFCGLLPPVTASIIVILITVVSQQLFKQNLSLLTKLNIIFH